MTDATLHRGTSTQLWYELVREGEARMRVRLPDTVESYLVFLLQRHQADALLGGRTMALECLQGLERRGRDRLDGLRDVGDRCLLIAGLFPRLARRRNVAPEYYAAIGQAAYGEVAAVARAGRGGAFALLTRGGCSMGRGPVGLAAAAPLAPPAPPPPTSPYAAWPIAP